MFLSFHKEDFDPNKLSSNLDSDKYLYILIFKCDGVMSVFDS